MGHLYIIDPEFSTTSLSWPSFVVVFFFSKNGQVTEFLFTQLPQCLGLKQRAVQDWSEPGESPPSIRKKNMYTLVFLT